MTPSSTACPPTRVSSPLSRAGSSCVAASNRRYCFQKVIDLQVVKHGNLCRLPTHTQSIIREGIQNYRLDRTEYGLRSA